MPALVQTNFIGKIAWLGCVPDREVSLQSVPLPSIFASFSGLDGDDHAGLNRASCARVISQYPKGTEIRNTRQFSIVSAEELEEIAIKMGVSTLDPAWIGASIVIRGLPDFSHLPPASRLQSASGATLTVDVQNRPCHLPAKVIDQTAEGCGRLFKNAAVGRRGVTAWVEREGEISLGDDVVLHIPEQRNWAPQ